ncbi:MAG: hypothetical protein QXY61_01890 [Candidatus Anstonellales archaeon]
MEKCATNCRYGVFKIPIENAYYVKLQILLGRRAAPGRAHPSGHVRDYTQSEAISLVGRFFEPLKIYYPDYTEIIQTNTFLGELHSWMFKILYRLNKDACSVVFGGPIFILSKSKLLDS